MKNSKDKTNFVQRALPVALIIAIGLFLYDAFTTTRQKELEEMSVEELNALLAQCIQQDEPESYQQACVIRDMIARKKA